MGLSSSNSSMENSQSVNDFDGEEEPVEFNPGGRFLKKEKSKMNPKKNSPPSTDHTSLDKYFFLQWFWRGDKEEKMSVSEPLHVDDDGDDKAVKDRISASSAATQSSSSHYRSETYSCSNFPDSRTICSGSDFNTVKVLDKVTGQNHIDSTIPHFLPDKEPDHINLDDDNDIELSTRISSSDLADGAGPSGEQGLEHGSSECDIEPIVFVYPKYVIYGKKRYWEAQMTFSCSSIKLDVSAVNEITEPFVLEWKTADLIKIESKWCERFKTANVSLHLKSQGEKVVDDAKSSGIVEIRFIVSDPHWSKKEETIKLLDVRYIDKWDVDMNFNASFEDVVYPEGDPDSVSVSMRDIELLQPERFINDTIVDFYIKYLKNKVKPEDNQRFHFFNSFFFRKMADFDKNSSRACKGSEAFQRVRKWTNKVNIFQKDYIFIPINFSLHWSLIIICHPGEVAGFSGEETEKSGKIPCILHMDSIKGSHRGLNNLIQSYLLEEWKDRSTNPAEDVSSKFLNLRFVPLELPQQQNSFDCGLFLLHYMELFVEQAPVNFSPFRLSDASRFLNKDWFPPTAASLKRGHIKKIIFEIAEYNSQKVPSSVSHENRSPDITALKEQVAEERLQEPYNSNDVCQESSCDNALQSIILTPVAAKPLRSVYIGGPEFARFGDRRFDEGLPVDENTLLFEQTASRNQFTNVMSPIEEGEETFYPTCCSPKEEESGLQLALITEPSKNITTKDAHLSFDMLPDSEESEGGSQIVRTGSGKYPISSEVHEKENYALALCESSPENAEAIYECSSTSSGELEDCVIEDSQEENENGQLDASVSQISHRGRRLFDPANQKHIFSGEDIVPTNHKSPAVPCVVEDSQEETEENDVRDTENYQPCGRLFDSYNQKSNSYIEEPLLKRPRLMSPRTEKRVTSRLSKGIQEIVIL